MVPLEQRDLDLSELLSGTLTDEERSDDQQSRKLHWGLFRGTWEVRAPVKSDQLSCT